MLRILIFSAFFAITLACAGKATKDQDELGKCGHCVDLPSAQVCTSAGNVRNSCVAICKGVKIECNQACPCPPVKYN